MAILTTATKKLLELNKKIRVVSGGTGASKTYSIMMILIDFAQTNKFNKIDVVSESFPHLEDGVMRNFREIMLERKYWKDSRWNGSKSFYTFETGTILKFVSFDKLGKAHGPRRDVLFVNECNNLPFNIVDQLITRTKKVVWLDYNPVSEFWYYTELKGKRDDIDFIKLTYLDNEGLSPEERHEIESRRHNRGWWRVYGEGELGELEGRIYRDWQIVDEIPHEARLERYGLDFGYTNDPTAIVAIYYHNGGWLFDERLYKKGLSNKEIADTFLVMPEKLIIADSAEPKSIDELRNYGLNVMPATKGKDSVRNGIQFVQDQPISVTSRSLNLIREYRNYLWIVDKNGKILNVPENGNDNCMDALRYALVTLGKLSQPLTYWDKIWADELQVKKQQVNLER